MYHNEAVRKFEHLMIWEADHAHKARSTHKPIPVHIRPAARVFTDKSFIGYANEVKAVLLYNELESAWGRSLPHNKEAPRAGCCGARRFWWQALGRFREGFVNSCRFCAAPLDRSLSQSVWP